MRIRKVPKGGHPIYNLCGDGMFDRYMDWKRGARYWRKKFVRQLKKQMDEFATKRAEGK